MSGPDPLARGLGTLIVAALVLTLVTPSGARAQSTGPSSSAPQTRPSSANRADEIMAYVALVAAPLILIGGGIYVDSDLIFRRFRTSASVNYGFSSANAAVGGLALIYGIQHRERVLITLGAASLVIGLIGLIATPIREAQRRDLVEDPGSSTTPLRSGFGWSFALRS